MDNDRQAHLPPSQRPASPEERAEFKRRVECHLRERGLSGRKLEVRLGAPRGTLAKLASGRVRLTRRLLDEIAQVLLVTPVTLVTGLALEDLLHEPSVTPESARVVELEREIDDLRARLAARDAAVEALRSEVQSLDQQRDGLAAKERDGNRRATDLAGQVVALQVAGAQLRKTLDAATEHVSTEQSKNRSLQGQLFVAKGEREELLRQVEAWRAYAQDRDEWIRCLNAQVQQAQAEVHTARAGNTGAGVVGAFLGVLGSAMLANDTRPSRRR